MAWRATFDNNDWITLSIRSAISADRFPNGIYIDNAFIQTGWITVTKTAVTTVWESRNYTLAAITAANLTGTVTLNAQGDVTFSRSYEIQRQNDAGAYKCVKTEMNVTITVT